MCRTAANTAVWWLYLAWWYRERLPRVSVNGDEEEERRGRTEQRNHWCLNVMASSELAEGVASSALAEGVAAALELSKALEAKLEGAARSEAAALTACLAGLVSGGGDGGAAAGDGAAAASIACCVRLCASFGPPSRTADREAETLPTSGRGARRGAWKCTNF